MTVKELLELHKSTTEAARSIMEKKNSDYCGGETSTDALANFKAARQLNLHPATGLLLRVQDKMMRVQSFVADGALRVDNESVEDACDDLVNYAILLKALFVEEKREEPKCEKCGGKGYYAYDDMHSTHCDECCKHDKGWWELTNVHGGFMQGEDNQCCRHCGKMKRELQP